jgi:hypothetical protein
MQAAVEDAREAYLRLRQKHSRMLASAIVALKSGHSRRAAVRERECRAEMLSANRAYGKAVRLLRISQSGYGQ